MKTCALVLIAMAASACSYRPGTPLAALDGTQSGVIYFVSSDDYDLGVTASREPIVVDGKLTVPANHNGGVFLLSHGSGGWGAHHEAWSAFARENGYATFDLNHFGPRNTLSTIHAQVRVTEQQMAADIISAAMLLASDPRIDSERIIHMGWSKGATAGLIASSERAAEWLKVKRTPVSRFIEFYPYCGFTGDVYSPARILILHGREDDWTPLAPCERLVAEMRAAGADTTIEVFERARHGFDNWAARFRTRPSAITVRDTSDKCMLVSSRNAPTVSKDGTHTVGDYESRKAFLKACATRGVTYGGSPQYREEVERMMLRFASQ